MDDIEWEPLGGSAPDGLVEARLQLHWAVQIVAASGALVWVEAARALATDAGAAIRFVDLSLLWNDESFGLGGKTLQEGLAWLSGKVGRALVLPKHDMPVHNVSTGGRFDAAASDKQAELARWYANAHGVLTALAQMSDDATAVTCCARTFAIHTTLKVSGGMVTVGMHPGDNFYDAPYFFIRTEPAPLADATFPALGAGVWHHMGWTGCVLTASKLVTTDGDQDAIAQRFVRGGVAACVTMLGAPRDSL